MPTPIKGDSFLKIFLPDIWATVVLFLPGEQIGRLKLTGAKRLWSKLTQPRVVTSVNLGTDFLLFRSWPAFLNEFPTLDELSINSHSTDWWSHFDLKFDSMPYNLRKLRISGNVGWCDFFAGLAKNCNLGDQLPHLEDLDLRDVRIADYSWMTRSPPTLTRLGIRCWYGEVALPTSLVHLETVMIVIQPALNKVEIPPGLETISTSGLLGGELMVSFLPLSFVKLSWRIKPAPDSFDGLERNFVASAGTMKVPEAPLLLLPKLASLRTYYAIPFPMWSLFPNTLTKLVTYLDTTTDPTGGTGNVLPIPFEELPTSIVHLELRSSNRRKIRFFHPYSAFQPSLESSSLSSLPYFPPLLENLKIPNLHISPETAQLFPSTLTYLEVANLCERVCGCLPKGLTHLSASHTLMSPNLIKLLPKSLTCLLLSYADASDSWRDHKTGEVIDFVCDMPEYYAHEHYGSNIDWKGDFSLPLNLHCLNLDEFYELSDSFILNQRLSSLLTLSLMSSPLFSDLCIPHLNRHLTFINLHSASRISGNCFPALPRALTYLNLSSSKSIVDSDIQHLPRTLNELDLASAIFLTSDCILELPPDLEWLNLKKNRNIAPQSFPQFPYRLRSPRFAFSVELATWKVMRGAVHTQ